MVNYPFFLNFQVEFLCLNHKPAIQVGKTSFTVGRAYLKRFKEVEYKCVELLYSKVDRENFLLAGLYQFFYLNF